MSSEGKRREVRSALNALYLEVPTAVGDDVARKVNAALDEAQSEAERLRERAKLVEGALAELQRQILAATAHHDPQERLRALDELVEVDAPLLHSDEKEDS